MFYLGQSRQDNISMLSMRIVMMGIHRRDHACYGLGEAWNATAGIFCAAIITQLGQINPGTATFVSRLLPIHWSCAACHWTS